MSIPLLKLGDHGSGLRACGEVQDFYKLCDECLAQGTLFEDPEFPAQDSSLFYSKSPPKLYEWKRPKEIASDPELFIEGASRFDVRQGDLGDCWLAAAFATLTLNNNVFAHVVPQNQGFGEKYAGIFHFRFWRYGYWVDVVIDDRLPTCNGQLAFLRSSKQNEFWSALLEKAYAKLHGSYEALAGGRANEALQDFTGGITEAFKPKEDPPNLYKIMLKAYEASCLMACSVEAVQNTKKVNTADGLVRNHVYSVTKVTYLDISTVSMTGKILLIRLRNPWGTKSEWNGPWSDKSPEWQSISDSEKEEIGLTFDHDGEFWMSFNDFKKHLDYLEICYLTPDSLTDEDTTIKGKKIWEMSMLVGKWVRGVTAGGCRSYLDTFWANPQYRITLKDPDEDDEDNMCTVIVGLLQKNRRLQKKMGVQLLTIGFAMFHLPDPDNLPKPLGKDFFKNNEPVPGSPLFNCFREVSCRFKLPAGVYCIVPSTSEPDKEGEFILRVFSENKYNMEDNDNEIGMDEKLKIDPVPVKHKCDVKIKEYFNLIAGDDMEVGWMELNEVLYYGLRNEMPRNCSRSQDIISMVLSLLCQFLCCITRHVMAVDAKRQCFSKDTCRSMIAMMDVDRSAKLGYEEFKSLWTDIMHWRAIFMIHDKENSGVLSAFELRQALTAAGYRLNNHVLNLLMHRYGTVDGKIAFDDFMMCAVKLKAMIDKFREKDPKETKTATFSLAEWIEKTIYS